ncbi:molybdenum cofactor guanylyltransferase MobA [Pararhodobacter sp.]|uniref:molybdenum cofactor guanylyltransferase MobA n=1 Tax=Pararhodobacter sp. TaxID=2127056 RepID=UPI002AFE551B|nr:molybdenum cofactor guanylyltransferase MobA [Pararhodobacter sp.]
MTKTIAGVILAGGRATRMGGGDKALLPVAGRPMLAHVIARLAPQVTALALNANGDPARFADFGLPVLPDPLPDQPGPLAGVLAGMEWAAAQGYTHLLTVAGDTPFLPEDLVARLAKAEFTLAASPDDTGRLRQHPTVGLWPVTLRESLRAALLRGERKVGRWAAEHGAQSVVFTAQPDPFFNVNTPDDLTLAEARFSPS